MNKEGRLIGFLIFSLAFALAARGAAAQEETARLPTAEYYGELGCSHCDDFKDRRLPQAEATSGVKLDLELIDILSVSGYRRCHERLAALGYEFTTFPVLILGDTVYSGGAAIEANLLPQLEHFARYGAFRDREDDTLDSDSGSRLHWAALPIFLAGLVDGINPCAFTTLLFFMSYLSLRGGSRRRVAFAGLSFAAGVFLAYFLIGIGLFSAFRAGGLLPVIRLALKAVVSALALGFCALTLRDILKSRGGSGEPPALRLPDAVRTRINASIRSGLGSKAFIAGVFGTGVIVAVLELACTGQVYFPAIAFMVQADPSWLGMGSLALYNLAFIVPLLAVLGLTLIGTRQEALRQFFLKHQNVFRLVLALVFAVLAIMVWLF